MGQWGELPFDGDPFAEMLLDVEDAASSTISKLVKGAARSKDFHAYQEQWAAIGLVIWAYHVGILDDEFNHLVDDAVDMLDLLESDREWMTSWRDQRTLKRTLKKVREELMNIRGHHIPSQFTTFDLPTKDKFGLARKR